MPSLQRQIILNQTSVPYTLKTSRRSRHLRLSVYDAEGFVVSAPPRADETLIRQFILKKSGWILKNLQYFKNFPPRPVQKSSRADFLRYKAQALQLARGRVAYFNQFYGFSFKNIAIKNQKTRWGSCSKKGNLNFNYKIILLPPNAADYIIVHELCHLGQFNHSPKFWHLVAQTVPDYAQIRKELRKNGINTL